MALPFRVTLTNSHLVKGDEDVDHVQIKVESLEGSRPFYEAVLGALGYRVVFAVEGVVVGIGTTPHDMFEVRQTADGVPISKAAHIAFAASSEAAVRAFYSAAIAHGATDNGGPGLRPHYEEGYDAAFVIDPNGHNLEAVFLNSEHRRLSSGASQSVP